MCYHEDLEDVTIRPKPWACPQQDTKLVFNLHSLSLSLSHLEHLGEEPSADLLAAEVI